MPDASDMELLREYAQHGSEAAFAGLVQRHIALVYSVALRHVGDAAPAEEITQVVFIILARKAAQLRPGTILEGWLHGTARLTALSFLRGERRRHFREQEAYMQSTEQAPDDESPWPRLAPLLDEALAHLGARDRDAVMLRFFKAQSMREVAAALQVNEPAAQRRILRAVEKLRKFFSQRGVGLSAAVLTAAMAANSVQAAPAALAQAVTAAAITQGATAGVSTLTLIKGALKIMAWTKIKTSIVISVGLLLAAGTTTLTVREIPAFKTYPWQAGGREGWFSGWLLNQQPPQVRILSSTFTNFAEGTFGDKIMGTGIPAEGVVAAAYRKTSARTILSAKLPAGRYDYIASLTNGNPEALQREVRRKFGVVGKTANRPTDVLILTVGQPEAPGLKRTLDLRSDDKLAMQRDGLRAQNKLLSEVCEQLEGLANMPVLDQTGLTNHYDFYLHLDWGVTPGWWKLDPNLKKPLVNMDHVKAALFDQLGLELAPTNLPLEMLEVDQAK
jgi:uncharacterized protein (TIGR03435 family)